MPPKHKASRLSIVYQDDVVVVVDKPSGVLSIPDRYQPEAFNALEHLNKRFPEVTPVHRLDKDTSGLLLFALSDEAHRIVSRQFEDRIVTKLYRALVVGLVSQEEFTIDYPLRVNGDRRHRTVVDHRNGKLSTTIFRLIKPLAKYSLIEAQPVTGRTHQIRTHLASVGLPIACDALYGAGEPIFLSDLKRKYSPGKREERPLISRLALHAYFLSFRHPVTGEIIELTAADPRDLAATINQLSKVRSV